LAALEAIARNGDWEIGGRVVHLTNLGKMLFPEDKFSKRDLVRYYCEVAPVLIPYYSQRPLSMNPHPDGIHGKSYWVKDKPDYAPAWIPTFRYQDQKSLKDWMLIEEVRNARMAGQPCRHRPPSMVFARGQAGVPRLVGRRPGPGRGRHLQGRDRGGESRQGRTRSSQAQGAAQNDRSERAAHLHSRSNAATPSIKAVALSRGSRT